jgi:hypothetical protein
MLGERPSPYPDDRRYLNWKLRGESKVPVDHSGVPCDAHDPANHRTYAEVAKLGAVGRDIFSPELGVDFDWKHDPRAGEPGYIPQQVLDYLKRMPLTYAEWSPSLKGIHLWYVVRDGHDKLPSAAKKNFEAYSRGRFLTLTFNHLAHSAGDISCISFEQAMSIFELAGYDGIGTATVSDETGEGWWNTQALAAVLQVMADSIPDFHFTSHKDNKFSVTCPGAEGWSDGARHSNSSGKTGDAVVWVQDGWPCFSCCRTKCQAEPKKSWRDFCDYYCVNSERLWDEWTEGALDGR